MTAAITDLMMKVAHRGTRTSILTPGKQPVDTSITLSNPAGWPTDTAIIFSMFIEDPSTGTEELGSYTMWKGVVNGSNVQNLQLVYGTDQVYPTGAIAIMHISTDWANSLVQGFLVSHNQDGSLKTAAVQAALNTSSTSSPDWTLLATTPTLNASNGQREHQLKFTGVDYTDRLQTGTKLKIPRTSTVPTQNTSLNGTSQYWSKSSPAGLTFTDDFAVSAWVKLAAYNGTVQIIASRYNGTSGFDFELDSSGRVSLIGYNASAANYSLVQTIQSLPLNKWVHVSAQLDMSTFTATPTTSYIMFDGVDVPSSVARAGTNPTALVQAGNLEVGSRNGGTFPFQGKLAHVSVYGAKLTQQQVRDSMNTARTGSETNLVFATKFNGNGNDLTANANNLVGSGGAVATDVDNPMNATEYAVVTKVVKTGSDTFVTIFAPTGTGIPNETLGAVSYSSTQSPFGFPTAKHRWSVTFMARTQVSVPTGSVNVYFNVGGYLLSVPIGDWRLSYSGRNLTTAATNIAFLSAYAALSMAAGGNAIDPQVVGYGTSSNAGTAEVDSVIFGACPLSITTTQSPVYLNIAVPTGGTNFTYWHGVVTPTVITAECAYI